MNLRFRPRVTPLPSGPVDLLDTGAVLARLADRRSPVALDAPAGEPQRYRLVAFDPLAGVEPPRDLESLRAYVARLVPEPGDALPGPFHGGFVGALSYDLGVSGEALTLPADPWGTPPIVGGLYTDFVVIDAELGRAWLVLGEAPGDGRPPLNVRRAEILERLARAPQPLTLAMPLGPLVRHTPPAEHARRIERARTSIAEGDFYQANLAHRFTRRMRGTPLDLFRRLRAVNPAPYMAFLAWGGNAERPALALCSASPELLLEFGEDGGRRVARTRPIKGTAARSDDPQEDARARERLLASTKDRAELAMIVDLERNDLGRIARPGSVRVGAFPRLETYAGVHHLVADVGCEPRGDIDATAVLAALFPGGSITGAPKLASMRAIAALEGEGRGFFTGSLGFLDTRGHATFNILIRTIVWRPIEDDDAGEVSFHVGGGITWSSDAAAEDQETLVKGARLALALEGEPALAR